MKKSILRGLSESLYNNYNAYLKDNKKIALLEKNIRTFEENVPDFAKAKACLKNTPPEKLPLYLDPFEYAALSYVALAEASNQPLTMRLAWLTKAHTCYQQNLEIMEDVGPSRFTSTLDPYELSAPFYLLKIDYLRATAKLHELKMQIDSGMNTSPFELKDIRKVISHFSIELRTRYKNSIYRQALDITESFEKEVKQELDSVNSLLKRKQEQTEVSPLVEEKPTEKAPKKQKYENAETEMDKLPKSTQSTIQSLLSLSVIYLKPKDNETSTPTTTLSLNH